MVDAIVSFAVQRLGDFLIQEVVFLRGVKEEVVWLKNELKWMQSFLKDAEEKQDSDERIRVWVSEIRDIASDTEEVIGTFILSVKYSGARISKRELLTSSVKKCFCSSGMTDLSDIGNKIEALKSRVLDISRKRTVYGISNIGNKREGTSSPISSIQRDLRITTSYTDEEHVVGFEDDARFLEAKLFRRELQRNVISILGMGGLGKTTLARTLYTKCSPKFDCHAWVCVSQEWKTRDLLERIIKSLKKLTKDEFEMLEMMRDYDLEQYLRELLEACRYLVVIDDVWQREAWESLRRALPDKNNGSRIIITTRIETVIELSDQRTYIHKLRFLRPDESWELFCKKAFLDNSGARAPDMEKLGEEMVAKCGGLPLAIIVLGGLLSRKQFHEWHVVKKCIWRELRNDSIHISFILALSFNYLPPQLKSCFLYLSIFPEDFVIDVETLIQLWVAEEFIPQGDDGLNLEDVAENYLKELIGRSLIQVVKRNWRRMSTCRVHDLLRDLAVSKAKELNFLRVYDETKSSAPSIVASSRFAFHSGSKNYLSLDQSHQQVRTLSFLNYPLLWPNTFGLKYGIFKFLRVLHLEGSWFITTELLEALGKLIHLRFLGFKDTNLEELPESIGNLQALQTLDVSVKEEIMLRRETCKLKQLRHLNGNLVTAKGSLLAMPLLFEELTNLQTLNKVNVDGWLRQETGAEQQFVLNAFAKLQNLKFLSVQSFSSYMFSVKPLLNCGNLLELKIYGKIENLPEEMHKYLPKLISLELLKTRLKQDPVPALERLPNLLHLVLDTVLVKIVTCTATGFPQLKVLTISRSNVTKLEVEEGAMPRLKAVDIDDSYGELVLPERLRSLNHKEYEW